MEISVLAFGIIADVTGSRVLKISDVFNTDGLKKELAERFPELATIKYSIAINKSVIATNTRLNQDDTVALLPPFSGG